MVSSFHLSTVSGFLIYSSSVHHWSLLTGFHASTRNFILLESIFYSCFYKITTFFKIDFPVYSKVSTTFCLFHYIWTQIRFLLHLDYVIRTQAMTVIITAVYWLSSTVSVYLMYNISVKSLSQTCYIDFTVEAWRG